MGQGKPVLFVQNQTLHSDAAPPRDSLYKGSRIITYVKPKFTLYSNWHNGSICLASPL